MRRLDHCNVIRLQYFFYSAGDKVRKCLVCSIKLYVLQKDEVYLNLVLDYIPDTVYRVIRHHYKAKQIMPMFFIKVGNLKQC